jgi:hypothetical protein
LAITYDKKNGKAIALPVKANMRKGLSSYFGRLPDAVMDIC